MLTYQSKLLQEHTTDTLIDLMYHAKDRIRYRISCKMPEDYENTKMYETCAAILYDRGILVEI